MYIKYYIHYMVAKLHNISIEKKLNYFAEIKTGCKYKQS